MGHTEFKPFTLGPRYIRENIPTEWKILSLNSMITQPISYGVLVPEEDHEGIPMIRSGEIDSPGGIERNLMLISKHLEEKCKKTRLEGGEILMALVGATIGQLTIAPSSCKGYNVSRALAVIRLKNDYISKFYTYFMKSDLIQKKIKVMTSGSAQPVINLEEISKFKFPIPTKPEQQKIASILSNVDDSIQKTTEQIEKTKQLKTGLMQKLLTKGIGHTEFKKVNWLFGKEIEIPVNWDLILLGSICEFIQGIQIPFYDMYSERKKNSIRYLYIQDFESDNNKKFVDNIFPNKIVTENDLVMANTGYYAGNSFKGKDGVLSNNAFKITFDKNLLLKDFLFEFLQSALFNIQRKKLFNTAGQPHVGHENIAKIKLALPLLQEQQKIASILSNVDSQIESLQSKKSQLQQTKRGLMQKLLTGKIRITV